MVGQVVNRFRKWYASTEVPPGTYGGARALLLPPDFALSWLAKRSYPAYRLWDAWAQATRSAYRPNGVAQDASNELYGGSDAPLEALRREGYAVLHPAFPEPWLQETRSYIEELYRSARARAESCGDESMEWREENGILVTLDRWRTFGRFRFLMPEDPEHRSRLPKPIQEYMRLPVARRIIESYYGCAVTPCRPYTMAEVLTPCPRVEEWHVDCLRPGVKAFLYLSDCAIEQGPLRYIPGTHLPDEQMHHRLYRVGRSGLTEAYFAEATNREFDQKGLSLTGKANSVVLFDNRGIHAGSVCTSGMRIAMVNGFRPANSTRINPRFFPNLPPPG